MSKTHNKKLLDAVRQKAWDQKNGLYVPRVEGDVRANWPRCMTCGRDVDAVELKNRNTKGVELWAKCHGAEDWYTVQFPYDIPENDASGEKVVNDHVRIAMRAFTPFQVSIA